MPGLGALALLALACGPLPDSAGPDGAAPVSAPKESSRLDIAVRALVDGDTLAAELAPEEVQIFSVELGPGEAGHLAFEQQGVDVVVEVIDPDGRSLRFDRPIGAERTEHVYLASDKATSFRLEVRALDPRVGGRYRLARVAVGPAGSRERSLARAATLQAEADGLRKRGDSASLRAAAERWRAVTPARPHHKGSSAGFARTWPPTRAGEAVRPSPVGRRTA